MEKKTGSLALIFLLIILLGLWWMLSIVHLNGTFAPVVRSTQQNTPVSPSAPISIKHTYSHGMENYSGSLQLSDCQDLATGVSASGVAPAHIKLLFTVTTPASCASRATDFAPFAISVSSSKGGNAVLDAVLVNNAAAAFSVINAQ